MREEKKTHEERGRKIDKKEDQWIEGKRVRKSNRKEKLK